MNASACGSRRTLGVSVAIVGLVVAMSMFTLPAHAAGRVLVKNGGFETGDLTSWLKAIATDGAVTSSEHQAGTYSMEMKAVDFLWQTFPLASSVHAFSMRFWAKADNPITTGPAYAYVYYRFGGSTSKLFGGVLLASGDWTLFTVPLDSTKVITKIQFEVGESPSSIFIDSVSLVPAPPSSEIDGETVAELEGE